jgi:glycerophosphoryl diester phosphodiesterase
MLSRFFDSQHILTIAHRGGARLRPENTMPAFEHAVSLGVDAIELDVRLSRDLEPVVIHDATLDRTTDAKGPVANLTVAELARVDAGGTGGVSGTGIVTLAEVLARWRDMPFVVELKGESAELARRTVGVIAEARAGERVVIGGFNQVSMRAAREAAPAIATSASTPEVRRALYRSYLSLPPKLTGYRVFQVPEIRNARRVVSPRFIRAAKRAGIPVQVWTVNEAADMRRLIGWGISAIITDRPDTAIDVVRGLSG